jgi:hypothetical protein
MLGRRLFGHRSPIRRSSRSQVSVHVAARAVCETLERRQPLTQFTFYVPQNDGYTAVYLLAGQNDGWVDVFKNTPTGIPVYTFEGDNENGTGMYIVEAGDLDDFLFVDQVSGADKPTGTPGMLSDNGIRVQASTGSGGHLRIEARPADELIRVTESTSSSATVEVRAGYDNTFIGNSRFGTGVNKAHDPDGRRHHRRLSRTSRRRS